MSDYDYTDMSTDDLHDVKAPALPAMWYHDGTREPVDILMHVLADRL